MGRPKLRNGQRLSRPEFFRRYTDTPDVTRAELLNGVVRIIAAIQHRDRPSLGPGIPLTCHGEPHAHLVWWLGMYRLHTPGVEAGGPCSIYFPNPTCMPEPDALLRIEPESGGRTTTDADGFLHGPPELIADVSDVPTTEAAELGIKLQVNRANGVREYFVWSTRDRVIHWFRRNRLGEYVPIRPTRDGVLRSRVFPGLWLNRAAMLEDRLQDVMAILQQGLASPEHAAFVEKLRKRAERGRR